MATVFDSLPLLAAAWLVLLFAEAVYVLLGFGAGLIAVGMLALLMSDLRDLVVVLLLVNLPAELYVVATSWRSIGWRGVAAAASGIAVGIPIGGFILKLGEPTLLLPMLGAVLVAAGGAFLLLPDGRRPRAPAWLAPPVGLLSGVLTGLYGTGGPPLIVFYQLRGVDKAAFRGSLMAIFLLMTLVRVPTYAALGLITAPRLWSALVVFPAVLVGAWLGHRTHLRLDERTFSRLVSVALVAVGLLLVVRRG